METGWIKCVCGEQYFVTHFKRFSTERGDSLNCPKCNHELGRWGKGTDDYSLSTKAEVEAQIQEEAKAPTCGCGMKMVPRIGAYGTFYGCARFPDGCNETRTYYG
ncbi:hypothetical protein P4H71_25815 [Paenibacillus kribbensis]|uniref:hypothetical protein n=1 Tax=Paenibacillus kribbensis TaxID=172713 RepID=UPI002DBF973E|nr:hypothetical protein [Paenibacillus kribbensis]MEC0237737.1 hypothetical protein [Paenibacillus kribbensis]